MPDIPYIPYFQTSRYRVATMVELADPQPGEIGADLGMGDGRISIAFAKAGIQMHGYELDEKLIELSKENILLHSRTDRESRDLLSRGDDNSLLNITILQKDFWTVNLSQYNIISCYPMPTIMGRLEHKLHNELKPGARVVLNYFPFLHWKENAKKDNIFLYKR